MTWKLNRDKCHIMVCTLSDLLFYLITLDTGICTFLPLVSFSYYSKIKELLFEGKKKQRL